MLYAKFYMYCSPFFIITTLLKDDLRYEILEISRTILHDVILYWKIQEATYHPNDLFY